MTTKMTTERLNAISTAMKMALATKGSIRFDEVKPTVKELLVLAYYEPKLTGLIGACGTSCDGTCETCETHVKQLSEFFCERLLKEQDEIWEEEERRQRELDELRHQEEQYEAYGCKCLECLNYEEEDERYNKGYNEHWDYDYDEEEEYDTGLEWNESGYFD
jgi:hypothetical protein